MIVNRTKRLTLRRALKILQMEFGTQVKQLTKKDMSYIADSICGYQKPFTREEILKIEDEIYSSFGY